MNSQIKNKKIIIFDLDGVIMDSIGFIREYIKNKYEGSTEEDFKEIFHTNFWDGLNKFKKKAEAEYIIREEYSSNSRAENNSIFAFEGVKDLVANLSGRYILVVNSSDSEAHIKERLKLNNIDSFFDFVAGKETSNNKVEKFNMILERYSANPDDVVFISDTIGDIIDSDHLGIDSVAVTWGVHSRSDFEKHNFRKLNFISDNINDFYELF